MARLTAIPTQAEDKRFAPSPFMPPPVSTGTSFAEQNAAANAPAQAPTPAANPLAKLNQIYGLNLGNPAQNLATRQATDALPSGAQLAGALGEQKDQQKAAMFAQAMQERGGMPVPGSPDFAVQSKVAEQVFNRIYGVPAPTNSNGAFGQPSTSYAPTDLRSRAIAAGGQEVQGYGGAMVSATPNAQGGNSFMLRQGAPTSSFMPPSQPAPMPQQVGTNLMPGIEAMRNGATVDQVRQSGVLDQQGQATMAIPPQAQQPVYASAPQPSQPSPIEQARSQYNQTLQAAMAPKSTVEKGFERDPNNPNAVRPVQGGSVDLKQKEAAQKEQLRQRQSSESAQLVMKAIDSVIPKLTPKNVGAAAMVTSKVPGSEAYDLANTLDTIKANIGFDRLQEMRAASPTGGALGQVVVKELEFLQAVRGSLNQNQSPAQLKKNLDQVRHHYERFVMANNGYDPDSADARKRFSESGGVAAAESAPVATSANGPIKITSIKRID